MANSGAAVRPRLEERAAGLMADPVGPLMWAFAALTCALAVFRFFDPDELEHVHATWHVLAGRLPFVDFFEHHNPLLWYTLAPVLAAVGESARAMIVFRLIFLGLTFAIARVTWLLAIETGASRAAGRLAVLLLLSTTTFVYVTIEIRPDVPQTLFALLSVLSLMRLFRTGATRHAAVSGLMAAISFLFLQKAVLLLAIFPLCFAVAVWKWRLPWRTGAWWLAAFAGPLVVFAAWLVVSGSWSDYVWSNYLLNARFLGRQLSTSTNPFLLRDLARSGAFWVLALAMGVAAARQRFRVPYIIPASLGWGLVVIVVATGRISDRYLAAAVPLLAAAVAAWIAPILDRWRPRRRTALAIVLMAALPGIAMVRATGRTNHLQLAQIQYLLDRSEPTDRVYDRGVAVNLFRPDVHYFWFLVGPKGPAGRRFAGPVRGDYVSCREIASAAFVYNARGELEPCALLGRYRATPYPMLFERAGR
jgi:hypothetical protein